MGHRRLVWVVLGASMVAAACGRQGAPLPPIVRVAQRTTDLSVRQEGTHAVLRWTYPSHTAAGGPLGDVEAFEVWRLGLVPREEPEGTGTRHHALQASLLAAQGKRLFRLKGEAIGAHTRGPELEVRDDLLRWYEQETDRFPLVAWYAVRTVCCGGRVSGFSNVARLVPKPPPEAPPWGDAAVDENGVALRWDGTAPVLIERSSADGGWVRATDEPLDEGQWTDVDAEPGTTWRYRLRGVLQAGPGLVVGEPGDVLEVPHPDVYPPEAPERLVCLPAPTVVRLRWDAVSQADTYRVFRRLGEGSWRRLNGPLSRQEYADAEPPAGSLMYAVKAVDAAGNESEAATCLVTVPEVR